MIAELVIAGLSFLQSYSSAILIIAGISSFLLYLFGRLIVDEMPPTSPSSKEVDFLTGVGFFVRIFYIPVVVVLIIGAAFTIFRLIGYGAGSTLQDITKIYTSSWFLVDFVILVIQSFLLGLIEKELKNYSGRLDFFEKHEEHAKKKEFRIWSYLWAPFSFVFFILLIYMHTLKPFEPLDMLSVIANGMVVLLIFLSTALIHGQWFPKPKIFIYTDFEKKPIEAFFIRWENDGIRVVPKDSSSLIIPKSRIRKIVYPKREQEEVKPSTGFFAKIQKINECMQKCLSEIRG